MSVGKSMADTNHLRRDDYVGFSENDPFAELTRIMGLDPRAQDEEPAAEAAAAHAPAEPALDDFSIDLEKELAGDFDFSDFDDPAPEPTQVPAPVDDWRAEPAPAQPVEADSGALDAGFDAFFAETGPQSPVNEEAAGPDMLSAMGDTLDNALEQELFSDGEFWAAEPEAPAAIAHAPEAEIGAAPAGIAEESWAPDADFELDFLEAELEAGVAPAETPAPQIHAGETGGAEESWAAEADFDLDFLKAELEADAAQGEPAFAPAAPVAPVAYEPAAPEPVAFAQDADAGEEPHAPAEPPSLSLEEELSLLLADDPAPISQAPASEAPVSQVSPAPVPSVAEPSYVAARSIYGLANYAAPASAFVQPQAEAVPAYEPAAAEPAAYEPAPAEPVAEEVLASTDDGLQNLFEDGFDFEIALDEEMAEPAAAAPAASPAASPTASYAATPEIETVEVSETVPPAADDLDIPEIDYGTRQEAASVPFDEFDAEFAGVFGELAAEEPAVAAAPVAASAAMAQAIQAATGPAQPAAASYMLDDAQWQAAQDFPEADLDYESDLERAIASSAYDDSQAQPAPRRRGVMVAAAAAGVVLLGGLGVFGMSMLGGGGGDSPALVRADSEPMKVRPENPGGATVPNQDNEVYQRVAGGAGTAPTQEQLITSAEEPVDVAARTAIPQETLAPGIDDEAVAGPVKSEDRIEPEDAAPLGVAEETALVTPRRVRTMVVRPDGTMAPREEAAPVQEAPAGQQIAAAPSQLALPAGTIEAAPAAAGAEPDDGPVIDMPQTVAVVPTRRVEPQAAAPAAQTPAAPVAQAPAAQAPARPAAAPAATPASAPAAAAPAGATSEWSMQIASQPTAEGAQSAYQDLARRYGSVLEGRGVNIVRADIEGRGTYYRVRIPASGRDEAIQLCTRFKAAGGSCFVSR
jgi:hypothetical protein